MIINSMFSFDLYNRKWGSISPLVNLSTTQNGFSITALFTMEVKHSLILSLLFNSENRQLTILKFII